MWTSCTRRCLALVVILIAPVAAADDPVYSGPQPGEKLTSFHVLRVDGSQAGKEVDPIELADGKATLLVFVHKLTRPGMALTRGLTAYAKSKSEHHAVTEIVWLDDDKASAEAYLNRAKKSLNFTVPVGISVDGGEGPGAYGLNRNVELTILVAKENKVTANFALVQPSVSEAATIAAELAKLIDQPPPTAEEIQKLAYPSGAMARRPEMRKNDGKPPARGDNARPGNDLRSKMQKVIAADISEEELRVAVKAIDDWVGDHEDRKAQLGRMSSAVLDRSMGSEMAQAPIKAWQQKYGDSSKKGQ